MQSVVYLNNADACFDYVVGKDDADEFDDVKVVARAICPAWYVRNARGAVRVCAFVGGC